MSPAEGVAAITQDIGDLRDDLAKLTLTVRAYCPRERLSDAGRAIDDIEVGIVKLELAIGGKR